MATADPLLDAEEVRESLPRIVLALADWCQDLDVAERLTGAALAGAATLPPDQRPDDLASWCLRQARSARLEELRGQARLDGSAPELRSDPRLRPVELDPDGAPSGLDDRLALLFAVCEPALPRADQLLLALRVVAGLSPAEVALHVGQDATSTAVRSRRALRALAEARPRFSVPTATERRERLALVLDCVAAMFTVAHRTSPEPPDALEDLGAEALEIADGLVDMFPADSEVRGLRAVVLLGLARRPGRVDDDGVALTLDQVDRSRWDPLMLRQGLDDATVAMQGHERFAVEAAVAALHAAAPSAEETDWGRVVQFYAVLRQVWASPAVEVAELSARTQQALTRFPGTPVEAAQVLDTIERRLVELLGDAPTLARRDAAFALADLRWRTGRRPETVATYRRLLEHVTSPPVRAFCERRLAQTLAEAALAAEPVGLTDD